MARSYLGIEKGIRVFKENSDTEFIDYIFDTGAPLGTGGETDDAPIGSQYNDRTNGRIYVKRTDTSLAADWIDTSAPGVQIDELSWRNEKVRFATDDTLAAGSVDVLALSDNDDMLYGDIAIGEYVIGDRDGTPLLFEVTALPGTPNITVAAAAQPLADNDTFVVQQYLPDPSGQEAQAIIHFPLASASGVKIGDLNWNFADGINLNGFTPTIGAVSGVDTVQSGMEKTEKGVLDLVSLSGEARNATFFTAFSSPASLLINGATSTIKSAFQRIFDLYAQLRGVQVAAITAVATVDQVPVASVGSCKWLVEIREDATPANRKYFEVSALNDGATNEDHSVSKIQRVGANFNHSAIVDVSTGQMRLRIGSSTAGITATARRIEVVKNVL